MEKDRGFRALAIFAICIAVVGLTVGYSALSTSLTVNTNAKIKGSTWTIKFDGLSSNAFTGLAKEGSAPQVTSTIITVDVELLQPGDTAEYTFYVKNDGDLDAKLSALPVFTGIPADDDALSYSLTYADGTPFDVGDTLSAHTSRQLKLNVNFKDSISSVAATDKSYTITAVLNYVQK